MLLEGVVELDILYVTENDDRPLGSLRAAIPFQHFMEIKGISPEGSLSAPDRYQPDQCDHAGCYGN